MRKLFALLVLVGLLLSGCDFTTLSDNRWTCGDHPVYINAAGAPALGPIYAVAAMNQLNADSPRVHWVYKGFTSASGITGAVVVKWDRLGGGVYGYGAPQPWPDGDGGRWTGGVVILSNAYPPDGIFDVYLHEWGHVAGLGHYDGPVVMNPDQYLTRTYRDYQLGDAQGLGKLSDECA